MNLFANNSGSAGGYLQGIYNYGATELKVTGNSAVGTSMTFEPNSYVYTSQTGTKVLKYYEASTLKQWPIAYGTTSAILTANVNTFSLQPDTKFYVVCKTLDTSYNQTSISKIQITSTGISSAYLTDLSSKVGQYLQVGFVMEGVTKTDTAATNGKVVLTIQNRSVVATAPPYPATSANQLLRNGNFNLSTDPNYSSFVPPLPNNLFWQAFEGAYVGLPEYVQTPDSPTPGAGVLILDGQPYAGAWYNGDEGINIFASSGGVFTLTFDAFFPLGYSANYTSISFFNYATDTKLGDDVNIDSQIGSRLGSWQHYSVRFVPTSLQFEALKIGKLKFKVQTDKRIGTALFNNFVLRQQSATEVGPQISTIVSGISQNDNGSYTLVSPLVGKKTFYTVQLENTSAQDLSISSISLSGTSLALLNATTPMTIAPGKSQSFSITASPGSLSLLSGILTINSNDKEVADQAFVVNLSTTPVNPTESFNGSETPTQLGWSSVASTEGLTAASSLTTAGGALVLSVDSSADDYPWSYSISKTFASPGALDLSASSLLVALKASGTLSGSGNNKIQVRLESLNNAQAITGSIQLGVWVDETTANSIPNGPSYRVADGINDRVVVYVPENSASYTTVGGSLSSPSTGVNTAFDTSAPYYRLVIQMTDRDFNVDAGNLVSIDSITLDLSLKPFSLANGSFELGSYAPPTTDPQFYWSGINIEGWSKDPEDGVAKEVVSSGDNAFNSTGSDVSVVFSAFAGIKAMKVYGQNNYDPEGKIWLGPIQTGTVYQEFSSTTTPTLASGAVIHARGMAKVFSIDPLTGGSTFSYGFKFMSSANTEISRAVTTLTASNFTADNWIPLTVNATIPAGTDKVLVISEFVQNASTDKGSVYLDDLSIGFGAINATTTVGSSTYPLVWSDEFDGTTLNSANWTPEIGGGGWGNNEQQTYTSNSENLSVGGGSLLIQAKKTGTSWTSARIISKDKRSFKYGKIEFRAKLPSGIGPWPAAWMMGNNISSVSWPACGEIDVMEWRGNPTSDANTVGHALHSPSRNGGDPLQPAMRSAVANPSTQFHTYAVLWESDKVTFSVDGVDKASLTPVDQPVFQKEFFLLLNLAMGGNYVGNTIASSLSSASYEVDYVRVYQAASATVTAPAAPAVPTFSAVSSTGFTVNWVAVSGATSYRLDVSSSSSFASYVSQDLTASGTSQAVTGLTPGTTYYARVRAVNSGGTSASSSNGTQATLAALTSYQQFLSGLGYSTSTAFNADANGDGVKEGIQYAFNGASPRLGTSPATITRSGNTLTYTFDIRNDSALSVVAQLSTNLASWADQPSSVITAGTGAATGYVRKIVTITTTEPRAFIRLQVTGN